MYGISIDLEALGTNVDSQITQIGACIFEHRTGKIRATFTRTIQLPADKHINATPATLKFWFQQVAENPAMVDIALPFDGVDLCGALQDLFVFYRDATTHYGRLCVWANGTKFDIGMLEYQMKQHNVAIPWMHNADRCMRTLRMINPDHGYCVDQANASELPGVGAHDALYDAVWQAKYISLALNSIDEQGINFY